MGLIPGRFGLVPGWTFLVTRKKLNLSFGSRKIKKIDLESLLSFLILGFLFVFTNPTYATAIWCYR